MKIERLIKKYLITSIKSIRSLFIFLTLMVSPSLSEQVSLAWDASSTLVDGYHIYYGNMNANYSSVIDVGNSTNAVVSNLNTGSTYYFAVKAYRLDGTESGFSNEVNKTFTTQIPAPVSSFSASPIKGVAPLVVTLTDTSTGTVNSRLWEFGDGTTSSSQSLTKTYSNVGTYTVKLTVTNSTASSTSSEIITVTTKKSRRR